MRRFCELDGAGQRVSTATWPLFANLVEWPFEPVWDQVLLISGYEVGAPLAYDLDSMVVEVRYGVVGQISPNGHGDQAYVEKVPLRIRPDDAGNWRIMGPPPQPHVFVSGVDLSTARRALLPGQPRFPTNSDFVWQMFRASGWEVDYESTADVPHGNTFRLVTRPAPGDIVVYFRDGTPYHLGILEDEGAVISATVNAGVVRAPREAFAGDAAFYRLLEPAHGEAQEEASPSPSVSAPTPVQVASPRRRAALTPAAKPTPRAAAVARKPKPRSKPTPRHTAKSTRSSAKPPAKPSGKARPKAALKPTPKPTPAAKRR